MYSYTPDQVLHMLRRHFIILTRYTDQFVLDNAKLTAIAFNAPDKLFEMSTDNGSNGAGGAKQANVHKVNLDDTADVAQVLLAINGF